MTSTGPSIRVRVNVRVRLLYDDLNRAFHGYKYKPGLQIGPSIRAFHGYKPGLQTHITAT